MTTAADEYRRQARECIRSANLTAAQDVKANLLAMADRWLEFAEAMERFAMFQAAVSSTEPIGSHQAPRSAERPSQVHRSAA